ncbi:MAG: hypothetical protein NTX87_02615 [Planctomycetota bacterium]|nr:hypothetical protein [Planctomycetota bacterium]
MNLYEYVGSNPANLTDPTGLCGESTQAPEPGGSGPFAWPSYGGPTDEQKAYLAKLYQEAKRHADPALRARLCEIEQSPIYTHVVEGGPNTDVYESGRFEPNSPYITIDFTDLKALPSNQGSGNVITQEVMLIAAILDASATVRGKEASATLREAPIPWQPPPPPPASEPTALDLSGGWRQVGIVERSDIETRTMYFERSFDTRGAGHPQGSPTYDTDSGAIEAPECRTRSVIERRRVEFRSDLQTGTVRVTEREVKPGEAPMGGWPAH